MSDPSNMTNVDPTYHQLFATDSDANRAVAEYSSFLVRTAALSIFMSVLLSIRLYGQKPRMSVYINLSRAPGPGLYGIAHRMEFAVQQAASLV